MGPREVGRTGPRGVGRTGPREVGQTGPREGVCVPRMRDAYLTWCAGGGDVALAGFTTMPGTGTGTATSVGYGRHK